MGSGIEGRPKLMRLFRSHRSVVSSSFCLVSSHDRQLQTSPLGGRGVKRRPAKVLPRASKRRKLAAERYTVDETSKHENGHQLSDSRLRDNGPFVWFQFMRLYDSSFYPRAGSRAVLEGSGTTPKTPNTREALELRGHPTSKYS